MQDWHDVAEPEHVAQGHWQVVHFPPDAMYPSAQVEHESGLVQPAQLGAQSKLDAIAVMSAVELHLRL
jgi:hypothetical protein